MTSAVSQTHLLAALIELQPKIRRLISSRVGRSAAADLTQDLFLRLARIGAQFPTREDARRYLIRVAINAATDHHRVEVRRKQILTEMKGMFAQEVPNPQVKLLVDERISEVDAALAGLPEKCRDVIWLSRVEGMTHTEIARKLGVSKSLVEKYAVRAILHCRAGLDGTPSR